MSVLSLSQHRNRGLIKALEAFLELAKEGHITGGCGVVKFGPNDHRAYAFGDYADSPEQALSATFELESALRSDLESCRRSK